MASLWGKAECPEHPFGPHQHGVGNALAHNGLFPETLSQWVYEVWFFISWGSQWLSTEPSMCCCPSEPLLKQLLGNLGCMTLGCAAVGEELRIRCDHKACPHPQHRGFAEGKQCHISPGFSSIETMTADLSFTGNSLALSKCLLVRNSVFFRFLARVETTEREPFTRLKLFRLCCYRGQHSLLFPVSLVYTSPHSRGVTLLFIKLQLSIYPDLCLSYSCPLLIGSSFP